MGTLDQSFTKVRRFSFSKKKKSSNQITMNCLRCNSPAISDTSSESPAAEDYSLTFTAEEGKIKYMSHPTCEVACTACHQPLDQGSKCWIHHEDSRVYCYDCYSYRTTQKICNICNDVIENLEYATMVSKDCHIHTNCLACIVCFKPWSKGQKNELQNGISTNPNLLRR